MVAFDMEAWRQLVTRAMAEGASDIHLSVGAPPFLRVHGALCKASPELIGQAFMDQLLGEILSAKQQAQFQRQREIDLAWSYGWQRFRINAFQQIMGTALSLRLIPREIPSLRALGCPALLGQLLTAEHGLILVTGRTGAGKTTTLAAFLSEINKGWAKHIITLEDPIEYIHDHRSSLISQRELGTHFDSFAVALRNSLRDDPDVILIGELRDADTIATALSAAETGHLVLGSLHTQSAADTVLRLESFFPANQQPQIRVQLATTLCAVITQQLLPAADGGRVCAFEVLAASPAVRNLIRQGKVQQLPSNIMAGSAYGMQTMRHSIEALQAAKKITEAVASRYLA